MATAKFTLGSVLGAVASTANSVVATLEVGNTLIEKAQLAATTSLTKQRLETKADEEVFLEHLIREKAHEDAMSALRAKDFCKQSADHLQMYQSAYNRFEKLLRETT